MLQRTRRSDRTGVAAVEFAVVVGTILVPVLIGVWEVGRLIHVQQIVSNSAREGARLAAQGVTVNQIGAPTLIMTNIDPANNDLNQPNVKSVAFHALQGAGLTAIDWDDVDVEFAFVDSPPGAVPGATEPWQGVKGQVFRVRVSISREGYNKVRWSNFGLVNPERVSYEVFWSNLVDDPFVVNTTLPNW